MTQQTTPSDRTSPNALQTGIVQLRDVTEAIKVRIRNPAKLRNLELFLLVIAWVIAGGAMVLVQLGALQRVDLFPLQLAAGLGVLTLALHITLRVVAREADAIILPVVTALNGIGIAMIYRIDIDEGVTGWDAASMRQIAWTGMAIIVAIVAIVVVRNHRVLARYRFLAMAVAILLLILPLVPGLGRTINGATVWIGVGDLVSLQPGELAKIALAIFFAGYLMTARDSLSVVGKRFLGIRFPRLRDLGPILIVWAMCMLVLVFQRDLGTSLLYFGLFLVMIYVATGRRSWMLIGVGLVALGGVAAYFTLGYVQRRIHAWIHAFDADVYGATGGSFQIVQGVFGMAHGGLLGTGLGLGRPGITPYANSDYIIPSLGEELGLAGIFAILALYLVLVSRGVRVGFQGPDDFTKLLAIGLAFAIGLQVFIVVGGVTRLIPLTGLTTPFLAAGGSSLLANWLIVALLLRLSDSVRGRGIA
ncbi:FtsW/RodA/SpoVE family cell cycle protein [Agrococcus jenensis]|uniref:Cell elongation-specific peptidoglycan biosynthesis regulator RodA n=1 Tax=Agrococcus jenensis TaxID=46353 RepID=A0A3N2ARB4_9MICO|nr:FtsW/RodA/SpoVE family cell cycle protein [Agrococcus jenensis]ROR65581.1 cell elongation-specific peptidoglycan biosynthesis regulator RodA [Agrococcus jenensis]